MRNIHTFDIFDTLLTRRCVEPTQLFFDIENDLKLNNFANIRIRSELNIANSPHKLDDIYQEMIKGFGVSPDLAQYLKNIEIEYELKNAIPITVNLDKVEDGDLLITDMYLPRHIIKMMLNKIGLDKNVGLIVSNQGKHSGDLWNKINKILHIEQHTGDNEHSDIINAFENGIYASHTSNHIRKEHEIYFDNLGFSQLSKAVREARLLSFSEKYSSIENKIRSLQINCNIPLLIIICFHIHYISADKGIKNLLFSSRDCWFLEKLYRFISKKLNWPESTHYFLTSRISRINPSKAYINYFSNLADDSSMVVDLCGTGKSLSKLYSSSSIQPFTYLAHRVDRLIDKTDDDLKKFITDNRFFNLTDSVDINYNLELVNYTKSGMFTSMLDVDGYDSFIPQFEFSNYPLSVINSIEHIISTQDLFISILENYNLSIMMDEFNNRLSDLPNIFINIFKNMDSNFGCMLDISEYHTKQDSKSLWRIKNVSDPDPKNLTI